VTPYQYRRLVKRWLELSREYFEMWRRQQMLPGRDKSLGDVYKGTSQALAYCAGDLEEAVKKYEKHRERYAAGTEYDKRYKERKAKSNASKGNGSSGEV
jgi:hypothetical protein